MNASKLFNFETLKFRNCKLKFESPDDLGNH